MEQIKEEIVGELYALRGELSVISREADEIEENDILSDQYRPPIQAAEQEVSWINSDIISHKQKLTECTQAYTSHRFTYNDDLKAKIKSERQQSGNVTSYLLGLVGGLGGFISFILFGFYFTFAIVLSCIVITAEVVILLLFLQYRNKTKKNATQQLDNQIRELESEVATAKREIEKEQEIINGLEQEKANKKEQAKKIRQECEADIEYYRELSQDIAQSALLYYKALEEVFGKLLNPVDWQHIDLIIYYLQTGRADSLKECLQLVDRQKQTNEIVHAVQQASDRICGEIRSGFAALGKAMVICFNAVSSQISALSIQIANQHSEHMNALQRLTVQNSEMLSATQLTAALQEKAKVTSEQLIKDVKFIKSRV